MIAEDWAARRLDSGSSDRTAPEAIGVDSEGGGRRCDPLFLEGVGADAGVIEGPDVQQAAVVDAGAHEVVTSMVCTPESFPQDINCRSGPRKAFSSIAIRSTSRPVNCISPPLWSLSRRSSLSRPTPRW